MRSLTIEVKSWWGSSPAPGIPVLLIVSLVLLAFFLRLPDLASRPLWYDEAFSVLFSRIGPEGMLRGTLTPGGSGSADIHPLLYYLLLWIWTGLFGSSAIVVRMLSVMISLIVLVVLVAMLNRMISIRAAAIAGLLYALSPFQIQYAQEARMYCLLSLWLLLGVYLMWQGCTGIARWPWIAFGVTAALAMFTHVLAVVFLLPLVLSILWFRRLDRWRGLLAGLVVAVVLYLPWGVQLPGQLNKVASGYWIERPSFASLVQVILGFITGLPLDDLSLVLGLFLSLTAITFLGFSFFRMVRRPARSDRQLSWFALLCFIPVGILFLISQVQPVFILRGLLPSGVMFILLCGVVLASDAGQRGLQTILGTALLSAFVLGQLSHHQYEGFPYAPFDAIGKYLLEEYNEGDVILHSNKLSMLPQTYYAPDLPQSYLADPEGSGSDTLAKPTQEELGLLAEPDVLTAVRDAERVFFLIFKQEQLEYKQAGLTAPPMLVWLQTYYDQTAVMDWGDLQMFVFTLDSNEVSSK